MIALHHAWGTVYSGHGMEALSYEELDAFFYTKFMAFMLLNRGFYPVFDRWLQNRHEEFGSTMVVFDGHASHTKQGWMMCANGQNDKPVQEFVDEHDGQAILILLLCCNPRNKGRITSKKSLVVYSRSSMSLTSMESGRSKQILHVPGHGDFVATDDETKLNDIAQELGYTPSFT